MPDARLRELARAAPRDALTAERLLRERVRAGVLDLERVRLAAWLGDEAAQRAAPDAVPSPELLSGQDLFLWSCELTYGWPEVEPRASLALAAAAYSPTWQAGEYGRGPRGSTEHHAATHRRAVGLLVAVVRAPDAAARRRARRRAGAARFAIRRSFDSDRLTVAYWALRTVGDPEVRPGGLVTLVSATQWLRLDVRAVLAAALLPWVLGPPDRRRAGRT